MSASLSISLSVWLVVSGASEGILVWYGQPSEVQFTRGGGVAEAKSLEF